MKRYSTEFKEAVLNKLNHSGLSVRSFAQQEGMKISTLYSWQQQFRVAGSFVSKVSNSDQWSPEEKFSVVLETSTLSEIELSEYCRTRGLYPEQVKAWRQACIAGNMTSTEMKKQSSAERNADKKRIRKLEKELNRKEKALAETAALLVLRKKLNAYWEEDEDS